MIQWLRKNVGNNSRFTFLHEINPGLQGVSGPFNALFRCSTSRLISFARQLSPMLYSIHPFPTLLVIFSAITYLSYFILFYLSLYIFLDPCSVFNQAWCPDKSNRCWPMFFNDIALRQRRRQRPSRHRWQCPVRRSRWERNGECPRTSGQWFLSTRITLTPRPHVTKLKE